MKFFDNPHRRFNILTGEWILVSPHRTKRPWQGKVENTNTAKRSSCDPSCYLCPGNKRANGSVNPNYQDTYAFNNDFPAILEIDKEDDYRDGLLVAKRELGTCRVICFSPNHALTLAEMPIEAIEKVVDLWQDEYKRLGKKENINYVQIFENKGEIMGCSNPHPHGQIWAQYSLPEVIVKKTKHQQAYWNANAKSLLWTYLQKELEFNERIIDENEHFVSLVPFWAVWPYEAMILPKRHMQHIGQLENEEKTAFASIISLLTIRYDNLFTTSFPYSAGIHQMPTDGEDHSEWHWHMGFYPPLLRSASVKKFMVGYELFAEPQRDITAEMAAATLRALPTTHYLVGGQ